MQFTTMSTQDSQSQGESMSEIESEGSFISADREAITADTRRPKATSFFVTTLFPNTLGPGTCPNTDQNYNLNWGYLT